MRRNSIRLKTVAAAMLLVGAGNAAESEKFVVRGEAAKQILEQNSINVDIRRAYPLMSGWK